MYRVQLAYDRGLRRPGTFFWIAELETIRARIKIGNAPEVSPVDVHLRFRGKTKAHGLVFVRPVDETTFLTESAVVHPDLPRLELLLTNVPPEAADSMRAL